MFGARGLIGLVGLALVAASGCDDGGAAVDDGGVVDPGAVIAWRHLEFRGPKRHEVDFLFVVDNSGSMCQEQRSLARNFRGLADFIFEVGDRGDFRIAVVSTDLRNPDHRGRFLAAPAAPEAALGCRDQDGGPWVPDTADCAELALDPVLRVGLGGDIVDQADLERRFRCLVTLGTQGDGFEGGLEAMRLALSCDGPNADRFAACCRDGAYDPACTAETDFLRPDALLSVVFLSDEDDCSAPDANSAASRRPICRYGALDADGDGIPDGYQDAGLCDGAPPADCFAAECGGRGAEACQAELCTISRSANSNCEWFRDTLTPVGDYFEFLAGLKAQPAESIMVTSIVGRRAYTEAGAELSYDPGPAVRPECDPDDPAFDPALDRTELCCPGGRCRGEIRTSCESANGEAFAGRRYLELAEAFGPNGVGCPPGADVDNPSECTHICVDDFSRPLEELSARHADALVAYCLEPAPAPGAPIRVWMQCLRGVDQGGDCGEIVPPRPLPADRFVVEEEPGCESRWVLRVAEPPPPGGELIVEYAAKVPDGPAGEGSCAMPEACSTRVERPWGVESWACVGEGECGDQRCVAHGGPASCRSACVSDDDCAGPEVCQPLVSLASVEPDICTSEPCFCGRPE